MLQVLLLQVLLLVPLLLVLQVLLVLLLLVLLQVLLQELLQELQFFFAQPTKETELKRKRKMKSFFIGMIIFVV